MQGTIIILALGDNKWGQMALSLCLSIKANEPNQKVLLVYEDSAVEEIKPLLPRYFDYLHKVEQRAYESNNANAFYTKTLIYDIAQKARPDEVKFLMIDADCIVCPSQKVSDWFTELDGQPFVTWCNDFYDFEKKERMRTDYTFWVEPSDINVNKGRMPQINSSFMYFEISLTAYHIFDIAKNEFTRAKEYPIKLYKGCVPDELCFNLACWKLDYIQPMMPYYPIFFQFANEYQNETHILHHYKVFGFAGEHRPSDWFVEMYNRLANYYRDYFGLNDYNYTCRLIDEGEIKLDGVKKCLAKAGDYKDSDGGIFNPDGIIIDGYPVVVMRKEKNLDAYKKTYTHNTAIPQIHNGGAISVAKWINFRVEDFRLFSYNGYAMMNFSCVAKNRTFIGFSVMQGIGSIIKTPQLPIETKQVEKNWAFLEHGNHLVCIYSLEPYLVFVTKDLEKWEQLKMNEYPIDWFHKGYSICNSTNPIDIGEYYLMFFHSKQNGQYFHGAVLLDKMTLDIVYCTKNSINIMDNAKGLHNGLVYVSGSLYLERQQVIRVYFGEADWNAWQIDFNKKDLVEAIIENSK